MNTNLSGAFSAAVEIVSNDWLLNYWCSNRFTDIELSLPFLKLTWEGGLLFNF